MTFLGNAHCRYRGYTKYIYIIRVFKGYIYRVYIWYVLNIFKGYIQIELIEYF